MQHTLLLKHDGPVGMHWGPEYPSTGDVLLAYFEGDDRLYLCRVEATDELGGNLVEMQLHRVLATDPRRYRDTVSYDFYHGDRCTIRAWEKVFWVSDAMWYQFLDRAIWPQHWLQLEERLRTAPQPVPDGKGGYTHQTIAHSLSREYDGA